MRLIGCLCDRVCFVEILMSLASPSAAVAVAVAVTTNVFGVFFLLVLAACFCSSWLVAFHVAREG